MRSQSHTYEFHRKDLLSLVGLTVLPVALFGLIMHWGAFVHLWPDPRPALDVDRTIVLHQAESSRRRQAADLVLVGDSSCLMDVSATQLKALIGNTSSPLNLATLSYLDLNSFANLLTHFVQANPNQLRTVVLLMNPEALRRPRPAEFHVQSLNYFYAGRDYLGPDLPPLLCALGVEIFNGRFLSRAVPRPLSGGFGRTYGFTQDLWQYLSDHHGSAVDPGRFDSVHQQGNAEYWLASSLEPASRAFRAALPKGVRLVVGITPLPQGFVTAGHGEVQHQLLETWRVWLAADKALVELPAVLPDHLFATATHLNEAGIQLYTALLAEGLK